MPRPYHRFFSFRNICRATLLLRGVVLTFDLPKRKPHRPPGIKRIRLGIEILLGLLRSLQQIIKLFRRPLKSYNPLQKYTGHIKENPISSNVGGFFSSIPFGFPWVFLGFFGFPLGFPCFFQFEDLPTFITSVNSWMLRFRSASDGKAADLTVSFFQKKESLSLGIQIPSTKVVWGVF